jgi:hypothetical protein
MLALEGDFNRNVVLNPMPVSRLVGGLGVVTRLRGRATVLGRPGGRRRHAHHRRARLARFFSWNGVHL